MDAKIYHNIQMNAHFSKIRCSEHVNVFIQAWLTSLQTMCREITDMNELTLRRIFTGSVVKVQYEKKKTFVSFTPSWVCVNWHN